MSKIKEKIVREIIELGKKNRKLRVPALVLAALFLTIYHAIRDFFLQFRYHPARQRILVSILIISLVVGQSGLLMVFAEPGTETTATAETEDGEAENAGGRLITAFAELPDDVKVQTVPVGTSVDELTLPDTLEAVCVVMSTGSEKAREDDTEDEEKMKEEIPEEQEESTEDAETEADTEQPEDADAEVAEEQPENADAEDAEEQPEDIGTDITDEEVLAEETFTVTMPEYQAENVVKVEVGVLEYAAQPEQETEQPGEGTVIIENITWQSEPEYDGNTAGEYIFTAVLPEGYEPAEGVSLPKISVTVEETALLDTLYALNAAEIAGSFTVTGGEEGEDYIFSDGVLMIISGTPITIQNTDPGVAATDRIEVKGGVNANITLAGVNIDVRDMSNTAAFKIDDDSTGNVTITLADGTTNVLRSGDYCAGLQKIGEVSSGTLTITGNTGSLTATGGKQGAGIGGGTGSSGSKITISGGNVTATGGMLGAGIGGGLYGSGSNIEISGGSVTATGKGNIETGTSGGAGIGGGGEGGSGSNITISGGNVTATGGDYGAGIGGGGGEGSGSEITISGGSVTATGGPLGAGIGGGDGGDGSDIRISGSSVIATGGESGAGIGAGYKGSGSEITISSGDVTATGGYGGAGIGGGWFGSGSEITISGGSVTAMGGHGGAGIGGGFSDSIDGGGIGSNITISNAYVSAKGGSDAEHIGSGRDGGIGSDIKISDSLVFEGDAGTVYGDYTIESSMTVKIEKAESLTVENGATLTNDGTIDVNGKLVNNGTIINNGRINYSGSRENNGIIRDPSISAPESRIDYKEEILEDLEAGASYTIRDEDGTSHIIKVSASGTIAIESGWFGKDISIMKNGTDDAVGNEQDLSIPDRPAAPTGLGSIYESHPEAGDSKITGLLTGYSYEVSDDGGSTWKAVTLSGTTITGLAPGSYLVRIKAGDSNFHGEASATVTIRTTLFTPTAEIDYERAALIGLEPGAVYSIGEINGESKEVKADKGGNIAIAEEWFGGTISIVRKGDGSLTVDSAEQEIYIPMKEAAPVTAKGVNVSAAGKTDGKITGLTADEIYEISTDSGSTWEERTADENGEITDLARGSYLIRTKAKDHPEKTIRSDSVRCTISAPGSQTGGSGSSTGESGSEGSSTADTAPDGKTSADDDNNQNLGSDNSRTNNGKVNSSSGRTGTEDKEDESASDSGDIPVGEKGTAVTMPEGETAEAHDDGTVTVPEGTVVRPGNGGPDITVGEMGGTVDEDGNVTVPGGGSVRIGDAVITLPAEGGTIIPNGDGTVTVPAGSIITRDGHEPVTVTGKGAVFDPQTGIITIMEDIEEVQDVSDPSDIPEDVEQSEGGAENPVAADNGGNSPSVIMILVGIAVLVAGGFFILFWLRRKKK